MDEAPEKDNVRHLQLAIAMRMAEQFRDYIIRRTIDSKDREGKSLLNLPPFQSILGVVEITERETDIVLRLAEAAKEK